MVIIKGKVMRFRQNIALLTFVVALFALAIPLAAPAQIGSSVNPAFFGQWCAQGDSSKPTSITASPMGAQLTNEVGSTASGMTTGMDPSTITAPQWNLVRGTVNRNGTRIDWTNNTFWTRCGGNASGHGHHAHDTLAGTWYAGGDRSRVCDIQEHFGDLRFRNESGATANGTFDGGKHFTAVWSGQRIEGSISRDGRRIDWSNGTFWTR